MRMAIVGGLVVTLIGVGVVLLAAILVRVRRLAASAEEAASARAEEDRKHREATAAIMLAAVREVGSAVVRELRRAADERRATVERLMHGGLGPDFGPLDPPRVSRPVPPWEMTPAGSAPPPPMEGSTATPGTSTLPPDAPTPRSGYPVSDWLAAAKGGANDTYPHA